MKPLAALCQRLATALVAGIDVRTVWAREARQARGHTAPDIWLPSARAVNRGESVAGVLAASGDFFPPLFREMADVGEQSGHLGEVFARLAEHYQGQLRLRRDFLAAIAWPMLQLTAALTVVGVLIWVMGLIGQMTGTKIDMLGFGLVGNRGLAIYLAVVAAAAGLLLVSIRAASRGLAWTRPIQQVVLRLPVLGPALQTLALARLAWSMHLTMDAGMELRRGLRLSLRSTHSAGYRHRSSELMRALPAETRSTRCFAKPLAFPPIFSMPCRSASTAASSSNPWPCSRGVSGASPRRPGHADDGGRFCRLGGRRPAHHRS